MGVLDDIFGSSSNPAVPSGNLTKPLLIALLALLASRYMASGVRRLQLRKALTQYPNRPPRGPIPRPETFLAA